MKKYSSYKSTGNERICNIPSHWNLILFKRIIDKIKDGTHGTYARVLEGHPLLSAKNVFNNGLKISQNESLISEESYLEITKNGFPKKGDLLITCVGTIGRTMVYDKEEPLAFQRSVSFLRLNNLKSIPSFYKYYVESSIYQTELLNLAKTSAQSGVYMGDILNSQTVLPPIEEQVQIANYLDQKTTQIDELIAKKEQLIQLLEEERIAIINQAVTKGLNPDAPMKDSGIDWLGEIPEHWKNNRIDWIAKLIRGNTGLKKDELLNEGEYVALQYGKTYKINEVNDTFNYYVNSEYFKENQIVNFGDTIFISTSETIEDLGHSCYYNRNDLGLIGGEQILLKPDSRFIFNKYLYYYSKKMGSILQRYAKGLKVFRFKIDDLKQVSIPLPPIQEQVKIVEHLDSEMMRIRSLKKLYKKEIELLKEYKTTLISEVVTGKIDVREEVLN